MNERIGREIPAAADHSEQIRDRLKQAALIAMNDIDRSILNPPENPAPLDITLLESTPERVTMYLGIDDEAASENLRPAPRLNLLHLTALLCDRFQLDEELDESMRRINAIYDQTADTVGNVTINDIREAFRAVSRDRHSAPIPPTADELLGDI